MGSGSRGENNEHHDPSRTACDDSPAHSEFDLGITAFNGGVELDSSWPQERQEGWQQAWDDQQDHLGVQAYRVGQGFDPSQSEAWQRGWNGEHEGHAERVARRSRPEDETPATCGFSDCPYCGPN